MLKFRISIIYVIEKQDEYVIRDPVRFTEWRLFGYLY